MSTTERRIHQQAKYLDRPSAWLFLNNSCNHGVCTHCYLGESKNQPTRNPDLALEQSRALADQGYDIIPAGGELLLNPRYLEIYQLLGRKYILTNGLPIVQRPELAQQIVDHGLSQAGFTLHGEGRLNVLNGVSLEIVKRASAICQNAGLETLATVVLTPETHQNVGEFCQIAHSLGLIGIRFSRVIPVLPDMKPLALDAHQTLIVFEQIYRERERYNKSDLLIVASGPLGLPGRHNVEEKLRSPEYQFCLAGERIVAIGLDDLVYPCALLMQQPHIIGKFQGNKIKIDEQSPFFENSADLGRDNCTAYQIFME